jgi:hypothetical protein
VSAVLVRPVDQEAALRIARVRDRVLAVVRSSPGILTERAAAAATCSLVEVINALEFLVEDGAVEEAELLEASAWFPMTWCHMCGCTALHACDGGCGWTVEPGTQPGFGDLAGVCSRCA